MIDIHSHILPGVDDGASSWVIAVEMVVAAAKDGIRHIVATPHSNAQFRYDRSAFADRLLELRKRVNVPIELSLGCDFNFSLDNVQAALDDWRQFCIGSGPYLLVEFSDYGIPPNADTTLRRSEEHTSELQSHHDLVCRLLLEKKKTMALVHTRRHPAHAP